MSYTHCPNLCKCGKYCNAIQFLKTMGWQQPVFGGPVAEGCFVPSNPDHDLNPIWMSSRAPYLGKTKNWIALGCFVPTPAIGNYKALHRQTASSGYKSSGKTK